MEFWVVYWFGYTYIHILRKTWKAKTLVHFSTNSNCLKGYWHFQNGPYSLNKSGDLQQLKTTRKVVNIRPETWDFGQFQLLIFLRIKFKKFDFDFYEEVMEILFVVQCLSSLRKTDSISVLMIFYSLHFFAHISFILTHWKNCLLGKKRYKQSRTQQIYYIILVLLLPISQARLHHLFYLFFIWIKVSTDLYAAAESTHSNLKFFTITY